MTTRTRRTVRAAVAIAVVGAALAGCSSSKTPASPAGGSLMTMANGQLMTMAPGQTMRGAATTLPTSVAADNRPGPSKIAEMVCSAELRGDLREALHAPVPRGTSTYRNGVFRCTYGLPQGPLRVSVEDFASLSATARQFRSARAALPGQRALAGLTPRAVGNPAGVVVLTKDAHLLTVDATALPAVFGRDGERRADFAYEVASVILGCWTGD